MIEKKLSTERLLEIDNVHSAECGLPPLLDGKDKYVRYFENCYGEQWVFIGKGHQELIAPAPAPAGYIVLSADKHRRQRLG
jgi:hypothetical protein